MIYKYCLYYFFKKTDTSEWEPALEMIKWHCQIKSIEDAKEVRLSLLTKYINIVDVKIKNCMLMSKYTEKKPY